ncbi:MAG: hypothetical protein P1U89_23620 [Verrucomicrobiales bacterium]|nr:hypothetical protein [Verrucomicrobiales bacterium]
MFRLLYCFLVFLFTLSVVSVSGQDRVGPYTFQAWVIGRSHFHFQGNKVWIDHRKGSFMRPDYFKPVTVNGTEWKPPRPKQIKHVTEPFILPQRYPESPEPPLSAKVSYISDRGHAHVIQQPREENDYTTIVEVNDPPDDAEFLNFSIEWKNFQPDELDPEFLNLDGRKYKIVVCGGKRIGGQNWEACRKQAHEMGGELAEIDTKDKRVFFNDAMKYRCLITPMAIGGRKNPDGTFSWFSGKKAMVPPSSPIFRSGDEYTLLAFKNHTVHPLSADEECGAFLVEFGAGEVQPPPPPVTKVTPPVKTNSITRMIGSRLQTNTAKLMSLLVVPLGDSRYAGLSSKLSISALPTSDEESTLTFNQEVGEDMDAALEEVVRFLKIRHNGWPKKYGIELAFAEKYSPKDGPSAAVATALLMESLITGTNLDPAFAVTGDMNAAGDVQPIGGVAAKLRGAAKGGAQIVAIPEKNRVRALDLLLTDGVSPLLATQIFTIKNFEQAFKLAAENRSENLEKAITLFSEIQRSRRLSNPSTIAKLAKVVELAPNHLSARILWMKAQNRVPVTLSIVGSLEEIDKVLGSLPAAAKADLNSSNRPALTEIGAARSKLQRLRSKVDVRVKDYLDAWIEWASVADDFLSSRTTYSFAEGKLKMAYQKSEAEKKKLLQDVSVQEELLQ